MIYIHGWITHTNIWFIYTHIWIIHTYINYINTHAHTWIIYPWIIYIYVTYKLYTFELYAHWIDMNYIYELYIYVYLYDSVPFGSILVEWAIFSTRSRSERAPKHFSCSHLGYRFHCVRVHVCMQSAVHFSASICWTDSESVPQIFGVSLLSPHWPLLPDLSANPINFFGGGAW